MPLGRGDLPGRQNGRVTELPRELYDELTRLCSAGDQLAKTGEYREAIARDNSASVGSSPRLKMRPVSTSVISAAIAWSTTFRPARVCGASMVRVTRVSCRCAVVPVYTWICQLPAARFLAVPRMPPNVPALRQSGVSSGVLSPAKAISDGRNFYITAGQTWWALRGSNPRPPPCKRVLDVAAAALPAHIAHESAARAGKLTPEPPSPVSIRCQIRGPAASSGGA